MFKDYYQILGVKPDAAIEEIRRSYRELAFRLHPDRNPQNEEAPLAFLDIQEAYFHLSDQKRRATYDHKWLVVNRSKQPHHAWQDSYEMVRRRRESRYYREESEKPGGSMGPGSSYRARRSRSGTSSMPVSDRVNDFLMREMEARVRAFRLLAQVMRFIGALVVIVTGSILLDAALATRQEPEMVIEINRLSVRRNDGVRLAAVRTTYHRFEIYRTHQRWFRPGKRVYIRKSPLAGVITGVEVEFGTKTHQVTPYDSPYKGTILFFVGILMIMGLVTLVVRMNDEFTAYVGTFTVIALIALASIVLNF